MPSRIAHTKSRHGCVRCKQRRVKCDVRQPCSNCVRRREQCSLMPQDGPAWIAEPARLSPHIVPSPNHHSSTNQFYVPSPTDPFAFLSLFVINPQPQPHPSDWTEDLFLMNHYTSSTSSSLTHREGDRKVWQTYVPELAVSHPFLMHGLLAVSALHLSRVRPESRFKFETQSSHHQTIASAQFRKVLGEINQDNCSAVFSMCALLALISMISISRRSHLDATSPDPSTAFINDIIHHFMLTRGISSVMAPYMPIVLSGPLRLLCIDNALDDWESYRLPRSIQSHFDHLRDQLSVVCKNDSDPGHLTVFNLALDALDRIYRTFLFLHPDLPRAKLEPAVVLRWLSLVPSEYVTLLRERHPCALVLLAHFVLLFKKLGDSWFLQDWSEHTINMIKSTIHPDGRSLLEWPEEQLKANEDWLNPPGR